jgi:methyl-accepting chemotaxis protein
MRLQADQVTKAMREQARTAHEMSGAVANVSQDAQEITTTNRGYLEAADHIRANVTELREITSRNVDGVNATLTSTAGLANRARELGEIMDSIVSSNVAANGNQTGKTKTTKASTSRRRKSPPANTPESES